MRLLADAGVSPKTVEFLKQLGHEVAHVRTLGLQRAADADVVARARADSSVVLTFDLDQGPWCYLSMRLTISPNPRLPTDVTKGPQIRNRRQIHGAPRRVFPGTQPAAAPPCRGRASLNAFIFSDMRRVCAPVHAAFHSHAARVRRLR